MAGKYHDAVKAGLKTEEEAKDEARLKDVEAEKAVADQKKAIQDAAFKLAENAIGFLSAIAGKNKVMQKAAIIAESAIGIAKMIMANNTANIAALATPQAVATSGASAVPVITMNNISTGLGVASSIAATAKALSALGGGSAGSGGGAAALPQGASATPQVGFQKSAENQIGATIANNTNAQPPIQAFVVANEVTTAQTLNRNKIDANSI